ncbi:MAG: hypothetical protein O7G87_21340 [bacterium]|nr:hypothetical protein [bacterium]
MSKTTFLSGEVEGADLVDLSGELLQIAERIQDEMKGLPYGDIQPEALDKVEVAEQAVDERALELQQGLGELAAWREALVAYETTWFQVIQSLGVSKN